MRTVVRALHPEPRRKIWAAIDALRDDPFAGRPLHDDLAGLWRFPVGRLRIVYKFDDKTIEVVWVDRRETIYEDLAARRRQESGAELPRE